MAMTIRMSEAASLALHAVRVLAEVNNGRRLTTREIATTLSVSEAHLSKVLQRLVHRGLVTSTRGPKGGFALAEGSDKVPMVEVYEMIEGPLAPEKCFLGHDVCPRGECMFGGLIETVNMMARQHLERTTVGDFAKDKDRE
ncbi:MAG: Rrf2 family transcriptional regulator [Verrucomicrobia bacterium]|nr:Rrf2 family transcriptional regulator [Verrucomicrobiota bacterium]